MLRYQILNRITGQRYEFTAADTATAEQQIAANLASYGRDAWTETIPARIDATTDPPTEIPEQVIEHPAEREMVITDMSAQVEADIRAAAVAAVQEGLDAFARSWGYDSILSAVSYLGSTVPQFAAEAAALRDWRDATWAEVVRAQAEVSSQSELIARLPPPPARPT